jgi:single-strand DNA-binding protein
MAARTYITGNLGQDPVIRYTQSGMAALNLSVGCTPRRKDKNSDQWEDDGAPLWISATVWGEEAERLAEVLRQGTKVSMTGTLKRRVYEKRDGGQGESLELTGVRDLAIIPKADRSDAPQRSQEAAGGAYGGGAVYSAGPGAQTGAQAADVWGANQGGVPF